MKLAEKKMRLGDEDNNESG